MLRVRDKQSLLLHRLLLANARTTNEIRNFATPSGSSDSGGGGSSSSSGSGIGTKLLLTLLGAGAATGGTLAYAKSDQDFRKLLKEYAPWTDDAIALMYQEKPISLPIPSPSDAINSITGLFSGSEPEVKSKPEPSKPKVEQKKIDLSPVAAPKPLADRKPAETPKEVVPSIKVPEPEKPQVSAPKPEVPVISKPSVTEDDKISAEYAQKTALIAYKKATEALSVYSSNLINLIEHCGDIGTSKALWDNLKNATKAKEEALAILEAAENKIDQMSSQLASDVRSSLSSVKAAYEKARDAASVNSKYWAQVEEARKHFINELEILFPNADIAEKKLDSRGGDADALLLLALRRIVLYQQLLAKQDTLLAKRIDDAMKGSDEDLIKARIEIELEKERRNLAIDYEKKLLEVQLEADRLSKNQLKHQLEIHTAHLQDAMDKSAERAVEIERRKADEKAAAERAAHGMRLAAVLGRLQGVDEALKARSDADKMARQSQVLWAASEALEGALRRGGLNDKRVPLAPELDAIASAAADSDELVAAVLQGVPSVVREKGVLNETILRDRFIKVEKVCRSVALVPENGGSLVTFFLSWLQEKLLFKPAPPPEKEIMDEPTDFTDLDTYDILERAKFWVERGEWAQVVRYMQLLKGAPRVIARDWVQEATLHLEARQAAKALLAHASATGLLHL